jgi:hypothetical protein
MDGWKLAYVLVYSELTKNTLAATWLFYLLLLNNILKGKHENGVATGVPIPRFG